MFDSLKLTGQVSLTLLDKDGNVKESREIKNLVVTAGKALVASRMAGTGTAPTHIAVGSLDTPAAVGQTTLATEISGSRTSLSSTTVSNNVVTYNVNLGPGVGTGTIKEAGIFNAASLGIMLARTTFSSVVKSASDTLLIHWNITVN